MLVGLTAGAAALRFSTLGIQSYWYDEAITVDIVRRSFLGMLEEVPNSESTPPLYYVLAHGWSRLFGTSEAALRSLSAVFGVATVPAAYAAARGFVSQRSSLITAALVAASPLLVWYSQEARAYALLVLLATLSLVFMRRARDPRPQGALTLWAITSSLAVMTHYFAIFLVAAEGAWLLFRFRRQRAVRLAVTVVALVTAAIAPLALYQAKYASHTAWIANAGDLDGRLAYLVRQLVVGSYPAEHIRPLIAAVPVIVIVGVVAWIGPSERRGALLALTLGLAAIAPPLALAVAGDLFFEGRGDYFIFRNMIAATVPLTIAAGAVLGSRRTGRAGAVAAGLGCALLVAISIEIARRPELQRPNIRALAATLGDDHDARAIVADVRTAAVLRVYLSGTGELAADRTRVSEIDVVHEDIRFARTVLPPRFGEVDAHDVEESSQWFRIVRLQSRRPRLLTAAGLNSALPYTTDVSVLVEAPRE